MPTPRTDVEVLEATLDILHGEKSWCKGAWFRDENEKPVDSVYYASQSYTYNGPVNLVQTGNVGEDVGEREKKWAGFFKLVKNLERAVIRFTPQRPGRVPSVGRPDTDIVKVIEDLERKHPGIRDRLLDEKGVRRFIVLSVDPPWLRAVSAA